MSNLAQQVQRNPGQTQSTQPRPHVVRRKRSVITRGEKILWVVSALGIVIASIFMISNHAGIYSINKDIQVLEGKIDKEEKLVSDLSLKASELSEPLRIKNYAEKKLGMTFDIKNVKVVNN